MRRKEAVQFLTLIIKNINKKFSAAKIIARLTGKISANLPVAEGLNSRDKVAPDFPCRG